MAKFSRIDVALMMKKNGMVPVFYHKDVEICKQVVKAIYDGGGRVFEFTNRGDFATLVFADLNKWVLQNCPEMMIGVGSIVDGPTTAMYIALGSNFIVSPILNEDMAKICNRRKISWSPGCGSLTEINKAEELGAEVVKIFPGSSVGGPEFVKNAKGPCPWSSIMPTGGVEPTEDNLKKWFDAGVHCVGMGSQLFKDVVDEANKTVNTALLTQRTNDTLALIDKIRKK